MNMQLEVCVWMFVTFRILRFVLGILRYAGYEISNLSDSMLILYYFAAPACVNKPDFAGVELKLSD